MKKIIEGQLKVKIIYAKLYDSQWSNIKEETVVISFKSVFMKKIDSYGYNFPCFC